MKTKKIIVLFLFKEISTKHLYLTPRGLDGGASSRSNEESNSASPQTQHVYAIDSNRSVRESDLVRESDSPKHVYAFQ